MCSLKRSHSNNITITFTTTFLGTLFKMPLFSRSGFKSGKKPVKRKSFSLGNLSSLDETTYSINDLKLDSAGPLTMRLSGHEFVFTKGQWVLGKRRGNG